MASAGYTVKLLNIVEDFPLSFVMPGHGDDCGTRGFSFRACGSGLHYVRFPKSCHGAQCPEHWRDWMDKETARAYRRVRRYLDARKDAGLHSVVQHVVVSAPSNFNIDGMSTEYYSYLRWWVRKLCRGVGIQGAWMVFHHHRIPDKFNDYTVHNDGIHWHLIAFGKIDPDRVRLLSERSGWVIKGLGRPKDIRAIMRYCLSHCGIPVRPVLNPANRKSRVVVGHTATWWGCVAYNAFSCPDNEAEHEIYCPGCAKYYQWRDWTLLEHRDEPPDRDFGDIKLGDGWLKRYSDGEVQAC